MNEIPKDSINIGQAQQPAVNSQQRRSEQDLSIWLQDNGDGKFQLDDIVDPTLRNDTKFTDKIQDLLNKPLNKITKDFLIMQKNCMI